MTTLLEQSGHTMRPEASIVPSALSSQPRIRVCHVSLGLTTGGMERLLVEFARQADRNHFELSFVALKDVGQPAREIEKLGWSVELLPNAQGQPWKQFRLLRECLCRRQPSVVHTHNAYPHFYGTLAAKSLGVPVVVNTRHGRRIGTTWRARTWFWLAGLLADRVVSVSDDAARLCRQDSRLPASRVSRIWNGIDLDRFVYRGACSEPHAISVARLSAEKDFPTLIRAVTQAREVVPDLILTIVGDGPERGRMESLIHELGQQEHIRLLGERQDIPELLAQSGFFVTATLTEGISLTLLEAMAVGLPVLATEVGGNPEIVVPSQTGYLVPSGNVDKLTEALVRMCLEKSEWSRLGQNGRNRVEEHFNIRTMVSHYETLYREILDSKSKPV